MKIISLDSISFKILLNENEMKNNNVRLHTIVKIYDSDYIIYGSIVTLKDNTNSELTTDIDGNLINIFNGNFELTCNIIGSEKDNVFTMDIENFPEIITSKIEIISNENFSRKIYPFAEMQNKINLGNYTDYNMPAWLDANQLFQRHFCILGNTGSGKSETVAKFLEEIDRKSNSQAKLFIFDIHGEYSNINYINTYKIGENFKFPIAFFTLQDIILNILKLKEDTATNLISAVKNAYVHSSNIATFDLDIGCEKPHNLDFTKFLAYLSDMNVELINTGEIYKTGDLKGQPKLQKGEHNGKLNGIISQLMNYQNDIRYKFLFEKCDRSTFDEFAKIITNPGIASFDFSGIPHDISIIIIGIITRYIYNYQINNKNYKSTPIMVVCEEAHIYIPNANLNQLSASQKRITKIFSDIAKEGRKFGVNLLVATQRPSELNKTILAQCANFIVMKLNNDADKTIIKNLIPNGNADIIEDTVLFQPGDCLAVGSASPLISKIHIGLASQRPNAASINVWDKWLTK